MTELRWFAIATALIGCSSRAIEVGSNDGGADARHVVPGADDTEACRNGPQLPIVGNWQGYIENFTLDSGSGDVRITVSSATSAQACGKVTLGTAVPPPPPTDPNIAYPPGFSWAGSGGPSPLTLAMTEGFPMTILEGSANSMRLSFTAEWREFWKSWCKLQTPIQQSHTDRYSCVPSTSFSSSAEGCFFPDGDGGFLLIACTKVALCLNACACTEVGCTSESFAAQLTFDLRVSNDEASGSVNLTGVNSPGLHNVHLTRSK